MAPKAIVGVSDWRRTKADLRHLARLLDRGGRVKAADYELNFADAANLLAEISRERLRLLQALRAAGPQSVYGLARSLARNYSNVHADVKRLLALGLIERDKTKRIFVPWSEIRIALPLESKAA